MIKLTGKAACLGFSKAPAFVVEDSSANVSSMPMGSILVIKYSTPLYFEFFIKASAVVAEIGGVTSHAAGLARELNLPCIVAVENLMDTIRTGNIITVDAYKEEVIVDAC
jgi:phosphohistidine swiveling domain-containing protein